MLFKKAFLLPMKPLYESWFSPKTEAPDLATVKDFLRFKAAAGKGMIVEQTTYDSLNTFADFPPTSPMLRTLR
jgi:hypothetical protein